MALKDAGVALKDADAALPVSAVESAPIPKQTLYLSLDAWRGLACLSVLFYHSSLSVSRAGHFLHFISSAGYLGVQLFFVISGYCIANAAVAAARRKGSIRDFSLARIRRIFPAYLGTVLLCIGLSALARHLVAAHLISTSSLAQSDLLRRTGLFYFSTVTLTQIPFRQSLVQPIFWTLNFEVAFYVIAGLILLLPKPMRQERTILGSMHLITLASLGALLLSPSSVPFPFDFWPQFGLGVLVFDLLMHPAYTPTKVFSVGAVLEITLLCFLRHGRNRFVLDAPPMWIGYCVCLVFALLLLILRRFDASVVRLQPVRFLMWVGGFSYSLYLIHPLVIGVMLQAAKKVLHDSIDGASGYLVFGIEVAASILCGLTFFSVVERRFLKKSSRPVQDVRSASQGFHVSQGEPSQI